MYKTLGFWKDEDEAVARSFGTYEEAFLEYTRQYSFGALPDKDFLICDNNTGEVLFQASQAYLG